MRKSVTHLPELVLPMAVIAEVITIASPRPPGEGQGEGSAICGE